MSVPSIIINSPPLTPQIHLLNSNINSSSSILSPPSSSSSSSSSTVTINTPRNRFTLNLNLVGRLGLSSDTTNNSNTNNNNTSSNSNSSSCNDCNIPSSPTSAIRNLFGQQSIQCNQSNNNSNSSNSNNNITGNQSPRNRSNTNSPRSCNNSPRYSGGCTNGVCNIQQLPSQLLETILKYSVDDTLPSIGYIDMMVVCKTFSRVIELMRGFVVVFGLSQSHNNSMIRWYHSHYRKVRMIRFINLTSPCYSMTLLNQIFSIEHDASIDTHNNHISREFLQFIINKLRPSRYMHALDLSNCSYDNTIDQDMLDSLLLSISNNTSLEYVSLNLNQSTTLTPPTTTTSDITTINNNNNEQSSSSTTSTLISIKLTMITRLFNNDNIVCLKLSGLSIPKEVAYQLSKSLSNNSTLLYLDYSNNARSSKQIVEAMSSNQSITHLNLSLCKLFESNDSILSFQTMINKNTTIHHLDLSRNSFTMIKSSSKSVFSALSNSTHTIRTLNLSHTSPTMADVLLFPFLSLLPQRIQSLTLNNNYPFPDSTLYPKCDFISDQTSGAMHMITELNLSNLKLGDEKFQPLLQSLLSNKSITKLDVSINRLRVASAQLLAEYLTENNRLVDINLSYNFLKTGVKKICQALHNNTTLHTLNLYATQMHDNEAKALVKLLSRNTSIQHLNIGHNLQVDAVVKSLGSHKTIRTLQLGSTTLGSAFIKLIQRNHSLTTLDITHSSFSKWKQNAIASALLKNRSITRIEFDQHESSISKLLSNSLKAVTRMLPNLNNNN